VNNIDLEKKTQKICNELIHEKGYISVVDVLMRLEYLSQSDYENWRFGRIDFLERVCKVNLTKLSRISRFIRKHANNLNLKPSWTSYRKYGKGVKIQLRFSKSGNENVEKNYATHYFSMLKHDQRNLIPEVKDE